MSQRAQPREIACGTNLDAEVLAFDPAQCAKPSLERAEIFGGRRIAGIEPHQNTDAPHPLARLRARRERPRGRAADEQHELAAPHSITSSASASSDGGMVRSSVFAVLRLNASSNFVGSSTGRSSGFAPLRMRSTKYAWRRMVAKKSAPYDIRMPTLTASLLK